MSPGQAGSQMDHQFCNDIHRIAVALERVAKALESAGEAAAAVERGFTDLEEAVQLANDSEGD